MTIILEPKVLEGQNTIEVLRDMWMKAHSDIISRAKAAQLAAVRDEFCIAFNVEKKENSDDEGGGSISLVFPKGWTENEAEAFAANCLDLDLSVRDGGPGRYFQQGGVGTNDAGIVSLGMRWGLDI